MTPATVIVGAGLAGLVTALRCAELGLPVTVLCSGRLGHGAASGWAQGGIAAAVGQDDAPARHAADTLAAGAGLCDPDVVDLITRAAPAAIGYLTELGARFDRNPDGTVRLGLEGAHDRHRIVHARGDGTGAEVMRAVVAAARATPQIRVLEHAVARRLDVADGQVVGVDVALAGEVVRIASQAVVLATGGTGAMWAHTTNPLGSRGQGLALAARAGAVLRDLEMVQFHPTALDVGLDPMPLVSEAVRGAGALLVDGDGVPLTDDPLAARDVVARIVGRASIDGQAYLDARTAIGSRFGALFPGVSAAAARAGIDPATQLIPVRPAAHYHSGGVLVDRRGRTTVPGLWAVGEVASTGLHGANRLASNSLLEGVVCGGFVAEDLSQSLPGVLRPHALPQPRRSSSRRLAPLGGWAAHERRVPLAGSVRPTGRGLSVPEIRALMSASVGLLRCEADLASLADLLRGVVAADPDLDSLPAPDLDSVDDAALVALLITDSALRRRESRGGHLRTDHPQTDPAPRHTLTTLSSALRSDEPLPTTPVLIGAG